MECKKCICTISIRCVWDTTLRSCYLVLHWWVDRRLASLSNTVRGDAAANIINNKLMYLVYSTYYNIIQYEQ